MAIQHNAEVAVEFDFARNRYRIEPRNGATLSLPRPTLGDTGSHDFEVDLDLIGEAELGGMIGRVSQSSLTEIVFQPSGEITSTHGEDAVLWITDGSGPGNRFVRLRVCWVTGQVWTGGPWLWNTDATSRLTADTP